MMRTGWLWAVAVLSLGVGACGGEEGDARGTVDNFYAAAAEGDYEQVCELLANRPAECPAVMARLLAEEPVSTFVRVQVDDVVLRESKAVVILEGEGEVSLVDQDGTWRIDDDPVVNPLLVADEIDRAFVASEDEVVICMEGYGYEEVDFGGRDLTAGATARGFARTESDGVLVVFTDSEEKAKAAAQGALASGSTSEAQVDGMGHAIMSLAGGHTIALDYAADCIGNDFNPLP